ncbi:hypothetical protein QJS66_17430 [Kocuria rhizophila]|nr:hypothetical protein QJS66_17430 [Kocuria rhizophila]
MGCSAERAARRAHLQARGRAKLLRVMAVDPSSPWHCSRPAPRRTGAGAVPPGRDLADPAQRASLAHAARAEIADTCLALVTRVPAGGRPPPAGGRGGRRGRPGAVASSTPRRKSERARTGNGAGAGAGAGSCSSAGWTAVHLRTATGPAQPAPRGGRHRRRPGGPRPPLQVVADPRPPGVELALGLTMYGRTDGPADHDPRSGGGGHSGTGGRPRCAVGDYRHRRCRGRAEGRVRSGSRDQALQHHQSRSTRRPWSRRRPWAEGRSPWDAVLPPIAAARAEQFAPLLAVLSWAGRFMVRDAVVHHALAGPPAGREQRTAVGGTRASATAHRPRSWS